MHSTAKVHWVRLSTHMNRFMNQFARIPSRSIYMARTLDSIRSQVIVFMWLGVNSRERSGCTTCSCACYLTPRSALSRSSRLIFGVHSTRPTHLWMHSRINSCLKSNALTVQSYLILHLCTCTNLAHHYSSISSGTCLGTRVIFIYFCEHIFLPLIGRNWLSEFL